MKSGRGEITLEFFKKRSAYLFILLSLALTASAAEKPLGVEEYSSVDELAMTVASYFPKVQGEVTSVQGDTLTIALGKKDGLTQNMELTVWRDARDLRHPVTGAVIGTAEEEIGTVEITETAESTATAVFKKKIKDARAGDKARITPKRISIAVVPVRSEKPEIVRDLAERLGELGRFSVLEQEKVALYLRDKSRRDAQLVRQMAGAFNLDAVVSVGAYPAEEKWLVTTKIFYGDDGSLLDTIVVMLSAASKREALGEVRPFFAPPKALLETTPDLPFPARFFQAADFDGDGEIEYVFSDESRLSLYRLTSSGWRELWVENVPPQNRTIKHIAIDAADVNGNGKPEIFVTAMLHKKVFSYALEAKDGVSQRIADIPGFVRIIVLPGEGAILAGQDYHPETLFAGTVKRYAWSAGGYAAGEPLALPPGQNLYGFGFVEAGEARPLLVAFDSTDRLVVSSGATSLWKSVEPYPQAATVVEKPVNRIDDVMGGISGSDKGRLVRIQPGIMTIASGGNGPDDILVARNMGGELFGEFKKAELHLLTWTGARLDDRGSVQDLPGAALDAVARPDIGPAALSVLVRDPGGLFQKDSYRIMTYSVR